LEEKDVTTEGAAEGRVRGTSLYWVRLREASREMHSLTRSLLEKERDKESP